MNAKTSLISLKNIPSWLIFSLILVVVFFVIYNSRQIFFFKYESEYYENLYYHSQWNVAGSPRGISDGNLYKFVGYRLVQGENPFDLNFEAPPFGKYLYGLSEYFTGNPYWVSLLLYLTCLITFYYFTKLLFQDKKYALLVLLLFVVNPFIATQIKDTMLDLPLTTFFLLQTFFLVKYFDKTKTSDLILSGIFLGLATGTKIGVYTPIVFLISLLMIFWAGKKFVHLLIYPAAIFAGYIISYTAYFMHHKNPVPWIKLHEKQFDFYLGPQGTVDHLNQWRGIFLNTYQGWWGIDKGTFGDWSPVLPLGVIAAVIVLIIAIRKKQKAWIYLSAMTLSFLIINSFLSFYPRYLMPAVPGFILLIAYFTKKYWWILVILTIMTVPFLWSSMIVKNYNGAAEGIGNFISKRAYRELYRSINPEQRKTIDEQKFITTLENFYQTLGTEKIDVKVERLKRNEEKTNVVYETKYQTEYGEIVFYPEFVFEDINNQMVLDWKWDYVWPNYSPEKEIKIEEKGMQLEAIRRGGIVVARNSPGRKVYIITRHVKWNETLDQLLELTGKLWGTPLTIAAQIRLAIPDDFPRYIGILDENLPDAEKKASEVTGLKLKEFNYLSPVAGSSIKDINELIRRTYERNPELFYTNADIYFETENGREYILHSNNKERVILDL